MGIEFYSEAPDIAWRVDRACSTGNGRETREHGCLFTRALKQVGLGDISQGLVEFKMSVCGRTSRMYDSFGNAFMIKMENLLAKHEIFEKRRTTIPALQTVLVV